jgi:hypothetical protein
MSIHDDQALATRRNVKDIVTQALQNFKKEFKTEIRQEMIEMEDRLIVRMESMGEQMEDRMIHRMKVINEQLFHDFTGAFSDKTEQQNDRVRGLDRRVTTVEKAIGLR